MLEFLRGEFPIVKFMKLTIWQWFSLGFIASGVILIMFLKADYYHFMTLASGISFMLSYLIPVTVFALILSLAYSLHGKEIGKW